jgi:hypothetical protein
MILGPLSGHRLLVGTDDSAVEHEICVISTGRERVEFPFPPTGMTPSAETAMDRLPSTITFRQIAPMRSRPQNPQTSFYEQSVIRTRPTGVTELARHQRYDSRPLHLVQLVPLDAQHQLRASTRNPMNQISRLSGILNADPA